MRSGWFMAGGQRPIPGKVHDWASPKPQRKGKSQLLLFHTTTRQSSRLGKPDGSGKRAGQSSQVLVYTTSMVRVRGKVHGWASPAAAKRANSRWSFLMPSWCKVQAWTSWKSLWK